MTPTPVPTEKPLSLRVLHLFAEAESFRPAWNDLVARSGADIYQTFEWCSIWWKYYGKNRELHLLLAFSGEELVGLIPAFTETLWLGPARVRVAKLVGADFSLALCNLPVLRPALAPMVEQAIAHFFGRQRCDLLLFGPLSGPAASVAEILEAGQRKPDLVGRANSLDNGCNSYFSLPDGFEAYLKSLDKKQRSNFKRMMEQSAKVHRVTFDVISAAGQVTAEFEEFCQQHENQWRADGKLGHFGDWPDARAFNFDLVKAFAGQGMVRFYRILADDQVISSQYGFVLGHTLYWRLPARVRNPEWDRFSLGTLGLVKMIEALLGGGPRTIEGGRGHYGYKVQYGATELPLRTVQFVRRGLAVSIRVRLFTACAKLLNIVYYKVMFARLAPRLPLLRRTLWSVWIRSIW